MSEASGRTVICSVAFMDIVGYSRAPDASQMAMKTQLNAVISEALKGVAEPDRIIMDTGDGAAICFLGDPEDALFTATSVTEAVKRLPGEQGFTLRVGVNLGPVKVVIDINGRPNVIGDGINVAQRVMSFAEEGEILVSRSYYEVVSRLQDGNDRLFRYLGIRKDKHVREHQVYAFAQVGPCVPHEPPAASVAQSRLPPDVVAEVERQLTERIGPMARVIVGRAAATVSSADELIAAAATTIQDAADRDRFQQHCKRIVGGSLPAAEPRQETRPTVPTSPIDAADLAEAEQRLAHFIGPLAAVLVKRVAQDANDLDDLYDRLAQRIENKAAREDFLRHRAKP